jgi:hypothetical protein
LYPGFSTSRLTGEVLFDAKQGVDILRRYNHDRLLYGISQISHDTRSGEFVEAHCFSVYTLGASRGKKGPLLREPAAARRLPFSGPATCASATPFARIRVASFCDRRGCPEADKARGLCDSRVPLETAIAA